MPAVLAGQLAAALGQLAAVRLVVGGVHDADAVDLQPVAERQRRVIEVARGHADVADREVALHEVVVAQRGLELLHADREVLVLHLPGQGVAQRLAQAARGVHVPLVTAQEERREERKALDVVPVGVRDQHVAVIGRGPLGHQRVAEAVGAGAAVQDEQRPRRRAHLDARGVAAIADGRRPRLGDRPADSPEPHPHTDLLRTLTAFAMLLRFAEFLPHRRWGAPSGQYRARCWSLAGQGALTSGGLEAQDVRLVSHLEPFGSLVRWLPYTPPS